MKVSQLAGYHIICINAGLFECKRPHSTDLCCLYTTKLKIDKYSTMTCEIIYKGDLRSEMKHLQSGTVIETDAPTDNQGKGQRFSPTDLMASSLGSCMITTMAIRAADMQLNFDGTKITVLKIMSTDAPRRIVGIHADLYFTPLFLASQEQKEQLIRIARSCPVEKSLHPDIKVVVNFHW